MYESRFGFTAAPFRLSPDPAFYFDSRGHHRALGELRSALANDARVVLITGEIGAGKTTLIRTVLDELDPDSTVVGHVVSTQLSAEEVLGATSIALGLRVGGFDVDDVATRLITYLAGLSAAGRRPILIVDEAQNLAPEALEALAELTQTRAGGALQLCLVGQPELGQMVQTQALAGLRKIIAVSCHLGPIELEETSGYVEHRLRKVGWTGNPRFERGAFDEVFRWTNGVPRRINLLCNRLLLADFTSADARIDRDSVAQIARDMRAELGDASEDLPPPVAARVAVRPVVREPAAAAVPAPPSRIAARLVDGHGERGPLLCIAAGFSDQLKAAALICATRVRPELPAAKLVCISGHEALKLGASLFAGIDVASGLIDLNIAEGPPQERAAELRSAFQAVIEREAPSAIVVFDGSEAAYVCAVVAKGMGVSLIHIGAGLRLEGTVPAAFQRWKQTDDLADLLYTTDADASNLLAEEGVPAERIHCVGNLLVDAVKMAVQRPGHAPGSATRRPHETLTNGPNGYAIAVLGEPVNLANRKTLLDLVDILRDVARDIPIVWPMHPATEAAVQRYRLEATLAENGIFQLPAQPYELYIDLLAGATCVLTDSWSTQEETTSLGVPCFTIGAHPARQVTVAVGTNVAIGKNRALATRQLWECIFNGGKPGKLPGMWDGKSGARIANYLAAWLPQRNAVQT